MKDINASYGFENGDAIIKQLKISICSLIKNDIENMLINTHGVKVVSEVYRHHSDMLAVTFYADLSEIVILNIKDIITKYLTNHQFKISKPNVKIYVNTTIGCSKSASKNLMAYAEKALHIAKSNFEIFVFFDANFYKNESSNNNLIELIQYNIDNNKVEPYFQAIMCNKNETIVKYEALMRLFDREGNLLLPGAFLEKAKSYRLYVKLMLILINKVFDIIVLYKIHVNINLEYNDIINPLISDLILLRLGSADIGKYLTIEILESERIKNYDAINEFIDRVNEYQVCIAIDDFGTGFSNYEYILKLNVDYLKIDGSLIQKVNEDIYMNLIKSIVMFCSKQNIKTVAEYVSDVKILRYVKSLGIDYSQGYYIEKPVPIEQIIGDLSEG
jgi:EAL domain-containing protein (putative c-di-GMP-specific phosphodiesterase class I)